MNQPKHYPELLIVMPVYNERATIEQILDRVQAVEIEKDIILVDDGSTDGTREFLEALARAAATHSAAPMALPRTGLLLRSDNIKVFFSEKNRGKGAALRRGFQETRGEIVIIQDADLERGIADVVYGSRFLVGPHRVLSFWHAMGNKVLTLFSNVFTNLDLSDMRTCYKLFKREILQKMEIKENRFGFEPEVTAKVAKNRWRVYEVPISYDGRAYAEGKKIGWKDGIRGLWCILRYNLFD